MLPTPWLLWQTLKYVASVQLSYYFRIRLCHHPSWGCLWANSHWHEICGKDLLPLGLQINQMCPRMFLDTTFQLALKGQCPRWATTLTSQRGELLASWLLGMALEHFSSWTVLRNSLGEGVLFGTCLTHTRESLNASLAWAIAIHCPGTFPPTVWFTSTEVTRDTVAHFQTLYCDCIVLQERTVQAQPWWEVHFLYHYSPTHTFFRITYTVFFFHLRRRGLRNAFLLKNSI